MDKVIELNGQELPLRANAMNLFTYEEAFRSDIMDAMGQFTTFKGDYSKIKATSVAKLVWTMAKEYNPDFEDFDEWLKGLDSFPIVTVVNEIVDLITHNLITNSPIKSKNRKGAV